MLILTNVTLVSITAVKIRNAKILKDHMNVDARMDLKKWMRFAKILMNVKQSSIHATHLLNHVKTIMDLMIVFVMMDLRRKMDYAQMLMNVKLKLMVVMELVKHAETFMDLMCASVRLDTN